MSVLFDLTFHVYQTWGRYNEAITNYETYDEAIAKFNGSLEIARELGDREGIALTLEKS